MIELIDFKKSRNWTITKLPNMFNNEMLNIDMNWLKTKNLKNNKAKKYTETMNAWKWHWTLNKILWFSTFNQLFVKVFEDADMSESRVKTVRSIEAAPASEEPPLERISKALEVVTIYNT